MLEHPSHLSSFLAGLWIQFLKERTILSLQHRYIQLHVPLVMFAVCYVRSTFLSKLLVSWEAKLKPNCFLILKKKKVVTHPQLTFCTGSIIMVEGKIPFSAILIWLFLQETDQIKCNKTIPAERAPILLILCSFKDWQLSSLFQPCCCCIASLGSTGIMRYQSKGSRYLNETKVQTA